MELTAIHYVPKGLHTVVRAATGDAPLRWAHVHVVVDCNVAIQAIQGVTRFDYAVVLSKIRVLLNELRAAKVDVSIMWTPSHDKKPGWLPPRGPSPLRLRALNGAADAAAGSCMKRHWEGSLRQQRARRIQAATQ